jgi:hypothetical protein
MFVIPFILLIVISFILLVTILIYIIHHYPTQTFQSNYPTINNNFSVELLPTSTEPIYLPIYSVGTRKHRKNDKLGCSEVQSLVRDTLQRNSIEHQQEEYIVQGLPPSYNELLRQSSATNSIEEQSLQLPSYEHFIRETNEKD